MRATGPAEASQRRKAVRGRVDVPVTAEYGSIELKGETVDLSEAGLRARVRGPRRPARGRRRLDLSSSSRTARSRRKAEVVRTQARGARWVMSIRFLDIQEKDQDRVRRRVFQALREERAQQGRRRPARPAGVAGPSRGRQPGVTAPPPRLPDALTALRDRWPPPRSGLATPGRDAAGRAARAVADQIDDYLLPRLRDLDAPLLTVVGGSTGAGKSTLVNSLVGAPVTTAGVLRPTTRVAGAGLRAGRPGRLLRRPGAARPGPGHRRGRRPGHACSSSSADDAARRAWPLLDAPDVDSVVEANRELAGQLLAAADLWVFVTTAARYADAVPWDLLRTAQERGTALAVVLDRVPPEAAAEVAADLAGMLQRAGLAGARLFVVEERPLVDGRLPEDQVAPLRDWLHALAADQEQREPPSSGRP